MSDYESFHEHSSHHSEHSHSEEHHHSEHHSHDSSHHSSEHHHSEHHHSSEHHHHSGHHSSYRDDDYMSKEELAAERARAKRYRAARKLNKRKQKFHKLTNLQELTKEEKKKVNKKVRPDNRTVPARQVPSILYLEGFFALLLCFSHTPFFKAVLSGSLVDALLFQMSLPVLFLLLGYRLMRRTEEVYAKGYNEKYRNYILYPHSIYTLTSLLLSYLAYLFILYMRGVLPLSASAVVSALMWVAKDNSAYFGWMVLQFLLLLPLVILMKEKLQKRKNPKRRKRVLRFLRKRRIPWIVQVAAATILYELVVSNLLDGQASGQALYRFIALRFLFAFSLGVYLYENRKKYPSRSWCINSFALGLIYLIGIHTLLSFGDGMMPAWLPVFRTYAYTNVLSCLYIYPILAFLLYYAQRRALPKIPHAILSFFGQLAYPLIIVQAVFFSLQKSLAFSLSGKTFAQALLSVVMCILCSLPLYFLAKLPIASFVIKFIQGFVWRCERLLRLLRIKIVLAWCKYRIKHIARKLDH